MEIKNKLIIRNYTDLSDSKVLSLVLGVVEEGRVSETGKGKQYCFHTTFLVEGDKIEVSVHKNSELTETFYVYKETR
jgi:hypothetical protein